MRSNRSSLRREHDPVDSADLKQLPDDVAEGHLAENIMHFGRVLRRAGLPIGGSGDRGNGAVSQVGLGSRKDFTGRCFQYLLTVGISGTYLIAFIFFGEIRKFWSA